jgi:hypothetical protein
MPTTTTRRIGCTTRRYVMSAALLVKECSIAWSIRAYRVPLICHLAVRGPKMRIRLTNLPCVVRGCFSMALKGIKVIEMAGLAPAPFAGMILAGSYAL